MLFRLFIFNAIIKTTIYIEGTHNFLRMEMIKGERMWMNIRQRLRLLIAGVIGASTFYVAAPSLAEEQSRTIHDESIYDVLVDRYFNATSGNDYDVDTTDPTKFAGGDFLGIIDRFDYIQKLGFTTISLGSIFATQSYDGKLTTSYEKIEPHFGTAEQLEQLIATLQQQQIRTMVDLRLNNVSIEHEWAQQHQQWYSDNGDGTLSWDYTNEDFVAALVEAAASFEQRYKVGAIRLTDIDNVPTDVLNRIITAIREQANGVQIVALGNTTADVDAVLQPDSVLQWSDIFKKPDTSSTALEHLTQQAQHAQIAAVDTLTSPRITFKAAEENVFPPTRIKLAIGTILTLPTVPMMTYGTEISMNGDTAESSHQIQNFKVDEEIIKYIQDVQSVRNKSEALRTGDFEILHNKDGFIVFKRWNNEEQWIVAINNTARTQQFVLDAAVVGDDKQLSGLFEKDVVRLDDNGYNIVIDREIVELYQVKDEQGFNIAYIAMMALVYSIFLVFIWALIRRGKRRT